MKFLSAIVSSRVAAVLLLLFVSDRHVYQNTCSGCSVKRPVLSLRCNAHRTAIEDGIRIDESPNKKGLGAFATRDIAFGDYLGVYLGEVLTHTQVSARFWGKRTPDRSDLAWAQQRRDRGQSMTGDFLLEMADGAYFIDGEDANVASWTRFMNHAKEGTDECNVKIFDQLTVGGQKLYFPQFYATRHIKEGEELLWDYGPVFWAMQNKPIIAH